MLQGRADPDNIDQAVDGSDFMEMHLIGADAVNGCLGFSECGEHREHLVAQ